MQLSFLSQATQAIKTAGTQVASGASSAGQTLANWGGRLVEILSTGMTHMATYARSGAAYASSFFSSCSQSATAFYASQPYVAIGLGVATTAAIIFVAARCCRRTA